MKVLISEYLFSVTSLLTVVFPFSLLPLFVNLTEEMDQATTKNVAKRITLIALISMLVFAIAGKFIFSFFGININGLRIVGGFLFFIIGYDMLQARMARTKSVSPTELDKIEELTVTPFAIPMLCGPGAITMTLVLYQDANDLINKLIILSAIITVMIIDYLALANSKKVFKFLGKSGSRVFSRLMGLVIMMIAVEFFFNGLKYYIDKL